MHKKELIVVLSIAIGLSMAGFGWVTGFDAYSLRGTAWAQTQPEANATVLAKAVFPETKYETPPVAEGVEIQHDFVIENHGQGPLTIERVQTD
jgi:hypothetical protein